MTELLTVHKRRLLAAGFPLLVPDHPDIAATLAARDLERARLRNELDDLRHIRAAEQAIDLLKEDIRDADDQFFLLLPSAPSMEAFERAWSQSWEVMVAERAWPHQTELRRAWRKAMRDTKPYTLACFQGRTMGLAMFVEAVGEQNDGSGSRGHDGTVRGLLVA